MFRFNTLCGSQIESVKKDATALPRIEYTKPVQPDPAHPIYIFYSSSVIWVWNIQNTAVLIRIKTSAR